VNNGTQQGSWFFRIHRKAGAALGLWIVLAPAVVASRSAQAQTFTLLYTFTGGMDGSTPVGGVILDAAGNLYGTTSEGGNFACSQGCGTLFKVEGVGIKTVLHSFAGTGAGDGEYPNAALVRDGQGNLYGTTVVGGASGYGTVFKLDTTGKETVLHSFSGAGGDGAFPWAGVVRDGQGNLYGTTVGGGVSGLGTVFKVDTTGKETVLHSFTGTVVDGAQPMTGLVLDTRGNLYGTTNSGGRGIDGGNGVVFKVTNAGRETALCRFPATGAKGISPRGVVRDAQGNLYGTTLFHGAFGWGTVFKRAPTGTLTVLYNFTGGNADGGDPYAGVVQDSQGNLYGTTSAGAIGYGTVFKITP
jgi:uncharacterized repeat protein (TIGR03803 family)